MDVKTIAQGFLYRSWAVLPPRRKIGFAIEFDE